MLFLGYEVFLFWLISHEQKWDSQCQTLLMLLVCILNNKAASHCLNVGVYNIRHPSSLIILCENETDGCILNKKEEALVDDHSYLWGSVHRFQHSAPNLWKSLQRKVELAYKVPFHTWLPACLAKSSNIRAALLRWVGVCGESVRHAGRRRRRRRRKYSVIKTNRFPLHADLQEQVHIGDTKGLPTHESTHGLTAAENSMAPLTQTQSVITSGKVKMRNPSLGK